MVPGRVMGMRAGVKDEPGGLAETQWATTGCGRNIAVRHPGLQPRPEWLGSTGPGRTTTPGCPQSQPWGLTAR